jgi:hypothetical protein
MSIKDAMEALENMPMGGIGAGGASMHDIEVAEEAGHVVENDAAYHQAQKAWLFLNKVLLAGRE